MTPLLAYCLARLRYRWWLLVEGLLPGSLRRYAGWKRRAAEYESLVLWLKQGGKPR